MADESKLVIRRELAVRPEFRAIAEAAFYVAADALGKSADRVVQEWGLRHDLSGRPLITLELRDWDESAEAEFAPDELQPPEKAWWRFRHLWGDVLQKASDTGLKRLKAHAAEVE